MSKYSVTQGLDPVRLERQMQSRDAWVANYFQGILEAATAYGKTTAAMLCIEFTKMNVPAVFEKGILVIVPTVLLKDKWEKDLAAWGFPGTVETIQMASKQAKGAYECGLLILDEIHQCGAPVFKNVFESVRYMAVLGLTATLPEKDEKRDILLSKAPIIDSVSLKECLERGFVSPFQIYNYPVRLSEEEDRQYALLSKHYASTFAVFHHDFNLAMSCIRGGKSGGVYMDARWWQEGVARRLQWDQKRVAAMAYQWIHNTSQRKELLYNARSKHEAALELLEMFPDRLAVTFSQSIASAELMQRLVGERALAYHSGVKGGVWNGKRISGAARRRMILEEFASQEASSKTRVLCTAKAFDVGADIPHIDMGLVISGTSKSLQAVQRYGRTLRKIDGKRTIIIELYAIRREGGTTQDIEWLRKRQKTIRSQVSWITDPTQIV